MRDLKDSEILRIERCGKDFPTCGFVPCSYLAAAALDEIVHISCFATPASFCTYSAVERTVLAHNKGLEAGAIS